ncbi:hypothetical protein PV08_00470 [Exophiala spinifera]|uniref:Major facilitator superfamily (MFS) profile domain-containing protein n=1 Tax=Exophiala spinifera TaxID=91928 RepID=A0A0D2BMV8_9EURO|nr:uncharacterized protein PV08_00470 [Exophiala spinifera]KIW19895.1 hypothetical protein PV08_00470 [Exophiala spinifera]
MRSQNECLQQDATDQERADMVKDGKPKLFNVEADSVNNGISITNHKALVRKIDLCLLPLLLVSYMLQFLDKTTFAYSAILGLPADTKLVNDDFSWASSAFYFGYMVASYPASLGFIKFPIGKYLSVCMILWAVVLACHAGAKSFASLTALRVLLGVFESTISPGFTLVTGLWYTPAEHATRTSLWFSGNALGSVFGGLVAYAIAHIKHSLAPWKWLFIIYGLITFLWASFLLYSLPDTPLNARWLSDEQRPVAYRRPQAQQKSYKSKQWHKGQAIEALTDPKTWLLFVYNFSISLPNGGVSNFSTLVIRGFGYDTLQTLLLGMPGPAIIWVVVLISAYVSSKVHHSRCYLMALTLAFGLIGILLVRQLPYEHKYGRLVGIWLTGLYSVGFPLGLSLISSNVAGYTKKTTVAAILFVGYCAGNIGGPFVFKAEEAPHYESAFTAILACFCIGIASIIGMRFYLVWENRSRDIAQAQSTDIQEEPVDPEEADIDIDISDRVNKRFRYSL